MVREKTHLEIILKLSYLEIRTASQFVWLWAHKVLTIFTCLETCFIPAIGCLPSNLVYGSCTGPKGAFPRPVSLDQACQPLIFFHGACFQFNPQQAAFPIKWKGDAESYPFGTTNTSPLERK